MALSKAELAAIIEGVAAIVSAPASPAVAEAVTATPAPVAEYVSPFAIVGGPAAARASTLPAPMAEAFTAAPDTHKAQAAREAAAYFSVPGYSCTATVITRGGPEGERTVGHGFISKRDAGVPCPTNGCTGTIR